MTTTHGLLIKIQLLEGAHIPRLVCLCTSKTRWSMGSGFGREGPGRSKNTKMAGKCLFRITSEWFLDYCIYQLWKEFRDKGSFSDCWKDRIQGKEELMLKSKRFWAAVFNTKVRKFGLSLI